MEPLRQLKSPNSPEVARSRTDEMGQGLGEGASETRPPTPGIGRDEFAGDLERRVTPVAL